jgi:hypothetical protein
VVDNGIWAGVDWILMHCGWLCDVACLLHLYDSPVSLQARYRHTAGYDGQIEPQRAQEW